MRAITHQQYGGPAVLHLDDVEQPQPAADEVRVRVHATTVNRTDCGYRSGVPFIVRFFSGIRRPRRQILGSEFAGVVDAVGAGVTEFAIGAEVFGVNASGLGAHADFMCMRASQPIALKPAGLSFAEAAAVSDGVVLALTCLRRAKVGPGQRVLIYGASGSIGTAAVQLAKHFGAHVTAVCATKNLDLMTSLGADAVIDYTHTDPTTADFTKNGETYDVIFDAVGKHSFWRCRGSLTRNGKFLETDLGFMWQNPVLALVTKVARKKLLFPIPTYAKPEVLFIKELIEAGEYRPVIDRCYPLEDAVAATEYVESEQKTGNVVLTVA